MMRIILRWVLAIFYAVAGAIHLIRPEPFLTIMPAWVPAPYAVVLSTGVAEILGAVGLVQPFSKQLRCAAGWGLALYALCVWPANINHFIIDMSRTDGGLGLAYHVPRLFAQPLIIWLAIWVSREPATNPQRKSAHDL